MRAVFGRGCVLAVVCAWLACSAGCDRRYVISGAEALRVSGELSARGVAEVRAMDEQAREVHIQVRASDDYTLERDGWYQGSILPTDRESLGQVSQVVLYHDQPGDDMVMGGLWAMLPGVATSIIVAAATEDWRFGLPILGSAWALAEGIEQASEAGDDGGDVVGGLGAAFSALHLAGQLAGLVLIIYGGVVWGEGREVEGEPGIQGLTFAPITFDQGGLGGSFGFQF
ncbi:MAG TPA: hypothetical protein PK668_08595 [Myxococcota bacterium]|nr:hypothetical protein [Myxococcota bacterium]HRY92964.1 hypothetical protein [Myxococcota bacterium]HSA22069.1 hypothetical protein [Myxococcota bacterium]